MSKKMFVGESLATMFAIACLLLSPTFSTISVAVSAPPQKPPQKHAKLTLQPASDGFSGTCDIDSETAQMESHFQSDGSSISRVRHSDGHALVETVHHNDVVEFRFPGVKIKMDVAKQTFIGISDKDKEELQKFLQSTDATTARTCLAALSEMLKQDKGALKRSDGVRIVPIGLILAGMLLGEEPTTPSPPQSKIEPQHGVILAHAAYRRQSNFVKGAPLCLTVNASSRINTIKAVRFDDCPFGPTEGCFGGSDCNGCCAVGCSGCAYYTNECLAHDNCVNHYGHASCLDLFPAAAASLIRAYNNGRGDWPPTEDGNDDDFFLIM